MSNIKLELAPMEGITTYIYRNAFSKYFGGIDTYFSPFISAYDNKNLNFKEINDIKPEHNQGINLVPQVMATGVDAFLNTSRQIADMGYNHINLNFGCPSGTVTAKGKGAGALLYPDKLEEFLDGVFEKTDLKISVKTRIGYTDESEWERILDVYRKFPLEELIIHGRVREEFYKGRSRLDFVAASVEGLTELMNISYNGDINSAADFALLREKMPNAYGCMLGRGAIANPNLAANIKSGKLIDAKAFKAFNLEIMNEYEKIMSGNRNSLFRIKELWFYMSNIFTDSGKMLKKIQKCRTLTEYELIILSIKPEDIDAGNTDMQLTY